LLEIVFVQVRVLVPVLTMFSSALRLHLAFVWLMLGLHWDIILVYCSCNCLTGRFLHRKWTYCSWPCLSGLPDPRRPYGIRDSRKRRVCMSRKPPRCHVRLDYIAQPRYRSIAAMYRSTRRARKHGRNPLRSLVQKMSSRGTGPIPRGSRLCLDARARLERFHGRR
jgi:hypothetical protein